MISRSADIWVAWAIRNKRSIFFYDSKVLDLSEFAYLHPGGRMMLENFKYKDITNTLFTVFPHDR
jgi:cytochrome b involved in lipid metabolism